MADPIAITAITVSVPTRGDALVIHADVAAPANTRICLTIDGKPRKDTEIMFLAARRFSFSAVALLEPGRHVVSFAVASGELDHAGLRVEVLRA